MILPSLVSNVQGSVLITTFAGNAVGSAATAPGAAVAFAAGLAVGPLAHAASHTTAEAAADASTLFTPKGCTRSTRLFLTTPPSLARSVIPYPPDPSNAFRAAANSAFAFSI